MSIETYKAIKRVAMQNRSIANKMAAKEGFSLDEIFEICAAIEVELSSPKEVSITSSQEFTSNYDCDDRYHMDGVFENSADWE